MNKLFIDSWAWITLGDRKQRGHSEVKNIYNNYVEKGIDIFTTDYILSETITMLFKNIQFSFAQNFLNSIFESIRNGYINLEFVSQKRFNKAWDLRLKFTDKPNISFTDLTSFIIMDELSIKEVLTGDKHFETINMGFKKVI